MKYVAKIFPETVTHLFTDSVFLTSCALHECARVLAQQTMTGISGKNENRKSLLMAKMKINKKTSFCRKFADKEV